MRVKGIFIDEKNYIKRWTYIDFTIFIIGITLGAIYCALLDFDADNSLSSYLSRYFIQLQENLNRTQIFKNSLCGYSKTFLIIYFCSYIRPGILGTTLALCAKGFSSGFTTASFIKYYGLKGILIPGISLISVLIYLPALLVFSSFSMTLSINKFQGERRKIKSFNLLAICCFTIFCVAALCDAFITTTFMKLISSVFTNF